MKKKENIRGFIFDMDGTLFDTERLYRKFWFECSAERGFYIDDEMLDRMRGASMLKVGKPIFEARNPGYDFMKEREYRMEKVFQYVDRYGVPKKKGMDELFDWLDRRGYKRALGSSTARVQVLHYMKLAGYEKRFDFLCTGDMVENGKPAPDMFLLCAEKLGAKPEECVVVEDSVNGIRAGSAAGCFVIGIPDLNDLTPVRPLCDEQLSSLDEIISWMEPYGEQSHADPAADHRTSL